MARDDDDDDRPRKKRRPRDDEDDDDDDDRPRRKRRSREDDDDDDDDDRPRKKRRPRDDDDDDDDRRRPTKKKARRPGLPMPGLLIAMAVVALVVGFIALAISGVILVTSLQAISILGFGLLTVHGLLQGFVTLAAAAAIITGGIVLLLRKAFGRHLVFFGTLVLVGLRVVGFVVFLWLVFGGGGARNFTSFLAGQIVGQVVAVLIIGGIAAFFFTCSQNDNVNRVLR